MYSNGASNSQTPDSNPFEEEEWDEEEGVGPDGALVDNGEPGVPVKALYDYEGAEADELSFKQGKNKLTMNPHNMSRQNLLFLSIKLITK